MSVDGYTKAYPMTEIEPFTQPAAKPAAAVVAASQAEAPTGEKDPIETFLANGRLQINANVGLDGIGRLKQMLDKYEDLLKLMN